jgi:hypothetical protein
MMSDLEKALADIGAMRAQMARSTVFRGLGPVTLAARPVCSRYVLPGGRRCGSREPFLSRCLS